MDDDNKVPLDVLHQAARWACGRDGFSFSRVEFLALRPVLETLIGRNGKREAKHWFHPNELSLKADFFPIVDTSPSQADIDKRIAHLKHALNKTDANLLAALQFHGSTVAVTPDLPDLPLYDFVKTTAAIAQCLDTGNGKLRLVGGSISGIQSYLYDIVSKRAGKLLKGRSFYLQLLSDSLVETLLEKFGLSECHVVYSSGGGFYLLLPDNGRKTDDDFENFKSNVTGKIYAKHKTTLGCEFAISEAFDKHGKIDGKNGVWDALIQQLAKAKNQRLSQNLDLRNDFLFPVEQGGNAIRDEITNDEIDTDEVDSLGIGDDKITVSKFTKRQIENLGKKLKETKFWVTANPESTVRNESEWFVDPLGYQHRLFESIAQSYENLMVRELNNPVLDSIPTFYGGFKSPKFTAENTHLSDIPETSIDDPITFDVIAQADENKSLHRMGILRMDVDGLGKIFSENIGLPVSFARYSAISRSLDWFFKGYLNTIHSQFFERTVIIYSGGDDLFIVGRWLETLEMACEIQKEFKKWSCGNLSLSGGLAILPAKFPVMQGAELAGEKEEQAKGYTRNGTKEKNALAFFDRALSWEQEMPEVFKTKDLLEWLLDRTGGRVETSILRKIDMHAESRKQQEKDKSSPRWMWNMIYDFGRFADKTPNQEAKALIRGLAKQATLEDIEFRQKKRAVPFLYILQTAARWVELERRTRKNSGENQDNN